MFLNQLLFLDWFVNFFLDPFNDVMILIFLLGGMLVGIILRMYVLRPSNQILYCRERDGRGEEMKVIDEDAISLETNTDPELRFFKYGRAYEFRRRARAFTRFFGKEGTAYTWLLQGFRGKTDDKGEPILDDKGEPIPEQIELNFPSLYELMKTKWGKLKNGEFWKKIPEQALDMLRDNNILVTVNLEPGLTPKGYVPITESVIKKKADEDMKELMAAGLKGAIKQSVMDKIPWLLAGIGICALGSKLMGWW